MPGKYPCCQHILLEKQFKCSTSISGENAHRRNEAPDTDKVSGWGRINKSCWSQC